MVRNKIIFLDIDGVLNDYYSINGTFLSEYEDRLNTVRKSKLNYVKNKSEINDFIVQSFYFDTDKIQLLNDIVEKTNSQIVVTSTMRNDKNLIDYFVVRGFIYSDKIIGVTPFNSEPRGIQILNWIEEHNFKGTYLVVDDDSSDIKCYIPDKNYIKVKGLNDYYKNKIINKLNGGN